MDTAINDLIAAAADRDIAMGRVVGSGSMTDPKDIEDAMARARAPPSQNKTRSAARVVDPTGACVQSVMEISCLMERGLAWPTVQVVAINKGARLICVHYVTSDIPCADSTPHSPTARGCACARVRFCACAPRARVC